MKTSLYALAFAVAAPLVAQTPAAPAAKPAVHKAATAAAHPAAGPHACSKLPEISPKVPALPAGAACAKPLYTIVSVPAVRLDYVSPMEGSTLKETLGLDPVSFSLDYVDTKVGSGPLAVAHKFYTIHYTGYLTDGTKFDSSLDRNEPIVIPYGGHKVIPGWDTGFDGMHVGGKRRLFIPFQLAYGTTAKGPIPARSELIFDVELIAQNDTDPTPPPPAAPAAAVPAPAPPPAATAPAAAPTADPTKPTVDPKSVVPPPAPKP